jgi:hypothetical protein
MSPSRLWAQTRHASASTTVAGNLYVAGGRSDNGALLQSAAVYDMGSNGWTALPALPAARYGHLHCTTARAYGSGAAATI